jgi:hypothetical protein
METNPGRSAMDSERWRNSLQSNGLEYSIARKSSSTEFGRKLATIPSRSRDVSLGPMGNPELQSVRIAELRRDPPYLRARKGRTAVHLARKAVY